MPETTPLRVLVCGDRHWSDGDKIREALKRVMVEAGDTRHIVVVEGGARGADTLAKVAARSLGLRVDEFPAQWRRFGPEAGPIRNQQMLDSGVEYALAFHSDLERSRGTADMIRRLRKAAVPTEVIG